MADRQWFAEGVQIYEEGTEEFFAEGVQVAEDQAAAATATPKGVFGLPLHGPFAGPLG